MAQISKGKADRLWPKCSLKIWLLNHALNEEKTLERMIKSVLSLNPEIRIAVDNRSTDNTLAIARKYCGGNARLFKWENNFAQAKNMLTKLVPRGDWCLVLGADMELLPETAEKIKEFIKDDLNVAGKFDVKEVNSEHTRPRTLLWRSHPLLYWERLVHEEMIFSLYRMLELGIPFTPDKDLPNLGMINHYGDQNWEKRAYYLVLYEIDRKLRRANRPESDVSKFDVDKLVKEYLDKGYPEGLERMFEESKDITGEREYE